MVKKAKAPQRMSSAVAGLSVGKVRQYLNMIRNGGGSTRPEQLLDVGGLTVGQFAVQYLMGQHRQRVGQAQRRARRKASKGAVADAALGHRTTVAQDGALSESGADGDEVSAVSVSVPGREAERVAS